MRTNLFIIFMGFWGMVWVCNDHPATQGHPRAETAPVGQPYADIHQYVYDRPADEYSHSDQWFRDHMPKLVKLTHEEEERIYAKR